MHRRSLVPRLELLEEKLATTALSTGVLHVMADAAAATSKSQKIDGTLHGTEVRRGMTLTFLASGKIPKLGWVKLSGSVAPYVQSGVKQNGEFEVTTPKGTIHGVFLALGPHLRLAMPVTLTSGSLGYGGISGSGTIVFPSSTKARIFTLRLEFQLPSSTQPNHNLTLSPATLPNATAGSAYGVTLTATGGSGTYTFAVSSGSLPSWLTLTSGTGVLSGTPTATGTTTFTITATDSNTVGLAGSQAYTLTVSSTANPVRPQPTTLNTASSQYQNLVADFPLWITSPTADAVDLGPHGLVGIPSNVHVYTDPTMGDVFYASGSASKFAVPYNTYLDFGYPNDTAQPFTVSCWVKITIPSTSLTKANNPPNMYAWTFDANDGAAFPGYGFGVAATLANNGPIVGEWDVDGHEAQATMFGKTTLNDGNWHLLTMTYVPDLTFGSVDSVGNIYVDGVLDATSNKMAQLESPTVATGLLNPFSGYIGTDDDGRSSPWQGMFCDLRFYNVALSATQIAAMYSPATRWELYTPSGTP